MTSTVDKLNALVVDFKSQVLANSENQMAKHQVAGRRVLYEMLASAFQIGLTLRRPENKGAFIKLLEDDGLDKVAENYGDGKGNPWNAVVKILFGETMMVNDFTVFVENKSAGKYANVFRYLENHQVLVANVADFIETFDDPVHGAALAGIEAADRKENPTTKKTPVNGSSFKMGCDRSHEHVFGVPLPDFMPEGVKYGTMWFEVDGDQIVFYDYQAIGDDEFGKLARAKGRKLLADHNKFMKAAKAAKAQAKRDDKALKRHLQADALRIVEAKYAAAGQQMPS